MSPYVLGAIRAYPASILAAVALGLLLFAHSARRSGLSPPAALGFALLVAGAGLLGGRLYALATEGGLASLGAWSAVLRPGYRQPGVAIGMLLGLPLATRLTFPRMSPGRVADLGVPAVAFAFGLARLGCFLEGCCYGTESSLPWAVRFPGDSPVAAHQVIEGRLAPGTAASLPVHPLQLYFALLAVGCGLVTLALRGHTAYAGQLTLIFVMLHEGGKALLEVLRAPDPLNGGTDLQAVSALLALLALGGLAAGWFLRSTRPGSVRQDAVRD